MSNFVHLHVHTQYSLLDGLNRSDKLLEKAKTTGMEAVAVTDHGVLYGVPEFWKAAKGFGVKPIIGCEIYLSPSSHKIREPVDGLRYYHLLLLAKNLTGYKNLAKLVTIAHMEGMYYRPRVDVETLKKYSEGLICTTACLAGPLSTHIVKDEFAKAEEWLQKLHSIFGEDLYLEVQRNGLCAHDKIDEELLKTLPHDELAFQTSMLHKQIKVNQKLYEYSDKYKIPVVATTDAHYLDENDKDTQAVLFSIKDGTLLSDPEARKGYLQTFIKTPEEMAAIFSDMPEVLENSLKINEKIEPFSIKFDRVQPQYWNLPKDTTSEDELRRQTFIGAENRYGKLTPELTERIEYELMVINKKGYNDYFLVVGDIMQYARKEGIVVGVRGSAAGSVVAYALDITNIDPIKWELYFERFLNLERDSPPDIDMDIQDDRREEIIQYCKSRYGEFNVANIITFNKMMSKAAIRDVGRVMGMDLALVDKLSKMVVVLFGKPYKFNKMMEEVPEFKQLVDENADLQKLGAIVNKIEGLNRNSGVHAAGHLITPKPVDEYMAYQPDPKIPGHIVTQVDGNWIDKLDYMKFDFLGLRTLTIIKNALDYIEQRHGVRINLDEIPHTDEKTFALLSRAETIGVFQLESPPMQQYLRELHPETQEDICFMVAAYRPGPMGYIPEYIKCKHGQRAPEYLIPELESILNTTYGFPIYQEQLLKICMEFGGFTLGEGDVIRNALKKKQLDILQAKEGDFTKFFVEHYPHYGEVKAKELWGQLKPFADYGFNKAHAASYAVVSYWCAYLKAHYPLEFVTALMHSDLEDSDRIAIDIKEARRMGYKVMPPDVNFSHANFTIENNETIRFGLAAIKNVGTKMCEQIVQAREAKGDFANLDDFINKVGCEKLNRKALECLIKVGAFDKYGERNALMAVMPAVYERIGKVQKAEATGQRSMFDMLNGTPAVGTNGASVQTATPLPGVDPSTQSQRVLWEKELMGVFLTTHPLEEFHWVNLAGGISNIVDLAEMREGTKIKLMAVIDTMKTIRTKAGNKPMSFITFTDMTGGVEAVLFNKVYEQYVGQLQEARAYLVEGTVSYRNEQLSILVDALTPGTELHKPSKISINICDVSDKDELSQIKGCLHDEGDILVEILYGDKQRPKKISRKMFFEPQCIEVLSRYAS